MQTLSVVNAFRLFLENVLYFVVNEQFVRLFSTTCHISTLQLCYMHDIHSFFYLSVTLVDYDHIVQQKVEIGRIGWCLGYSHAKADLDRNIL